MFICIAGKNNIAVDVLRYILSINIDAQIGVVCNKSDTGKNTWQKSLRWFANKWGVKEYLLEEIYDIEDLVFLSLEYDRIINPDKFNDARLYNIHFSMLPSYKGMYTSVFPILNGEETVGVTFHKIDSGIDTGDIIAQKSFSLNNQSCREVYHEFIRYGTELVISYLNDVIKNTVVSFVQPSKNSSYYSKHSIDYNNMLLDIYQTSENISRQIRAFNFREYQLLAFNGKSVISSRITNIKSTQKPGSVIFENEYCVMISTIDYNTVLFYDRFAELMKACEEGDVEKVQEICNVREHINEKNNKGLTPLMVATINNNIGIVKFLISLGADIYATNNIGKNLLMYAKEAYLRFGDNTLIKLYKTMGLSEYAEDYYGNNLLFYMEKDGIPNPFSEIME